MLNKSTLRNLVCLSATAAAIVLMFGTSSQTFAQRDPFQKPGYMKPKPASRPSSGKSGSAATAAPVNYGPPAIEARIEYFKRLRETAAANGSPLPKVTSVLTLDEMAVTGIFKTPRGYAAMVEATPIKLSYTIYPGEKFFDGQLVAVEENRLVFKKVTKTGVGKFVASVENKPLRQYSTKAQIEGTAPAESSARPVETASNTSPESGSDGTASETKTPKTGNSFLSPLDEMNNPVEPTQEKSKKAAKKPVKVARNKHQ